MSPRADNQATLCLVWNFVHSATLRLWSLALHNPYVVLWLIKLTLVPTAIRTSIILDFIAFIPYLPTPTLYLPLAIQVILSFKAFGV